MDVAATDLEQLEAAWGGPVPSDEIKAFLRLHADKRATAIERVTSLQRLTRGSPSTIASRIVEADRLGISLKRLQALIRSWRTPSIAAITPYGRKAPRKAKANAGRDVARRIVVKALASNRMIAEPTAHRRVTRVCLRLSIRPPARMTVRNLLNEERSRAPLGATPSTPEGARQMQEVRPGEILLLTSMTFRAQIVENERTTSCASALMLVDARTGLIAAVDGARPITDLGRCAAELVAQADSPLRRDWRRPREMLLAQPLPAGDWRDDIEDAALKLGVVLKIELRNRARRWVAGLHWRTPNGLEPAPSRPEEAPDPAWPRLSRAEFASALALAVDDHATVTSRLMDQEAYAADALDNADLAAEDLVFLLCAAT